METKLINLTPHPITVLDEEGNTILTLPSEGSVRVQEEEKILAREPFPLYEVKMAQVEGLPEPRDGVAYVVSRPVALALRGSGRIDVLVPHRFVRDEEGKIVGCQGFAGIV